MRCTEYEKYLLAILGVFAFVAIMMLVEGRKKGTDHVTMNHMCFDTVLEITLYGDDTKKLESVIGDCFAKCDEYERLFSCQKDNSELSMLNATAYKEKYKVSPELYDIIVLSKEYYQKTDFSFDISLGKLSDLWNIGGGRTTLPSKREISAALKLSGPENILCNNGYISYLEDIKVDLGAVAKGYTADALKKMILEAGVDEGIINFGGNILVIGDKGGKGYTVGIKDPRGDGVKLKLNIKDLSLVTSGDYERYVEIDGKRYHHILDNYTGYPADNCIVSTSVIGKESVICDILSTAVFVLGDKKGMALLESMDGYEGVIILDNGGTIESKGFSQYK